MDDMWALTFDRSREGWESSTGMALERIPAPRIDEHVDNLDAYRVIIRVNYAGFCGTDRSIWWRKAFGDMILGSLDKEGVDRRVFGHEMLGEVLEIGSRVTEKYGITPGDIVTTESHIVCGGCYQCRLGELHVCARETIIGVSQDGCFAELVKLPAKALWRTNLDRIRPEVAAVQEPFGNAVHACSVNDLRGKTVAILGTGTIGLFAVLIARGMGAHRVIGIEPNPHHQDLCRRLGADLVVDPGAPDPDQPWRSSGPLHEQISDFTDGVGVDVSLEMSGFNSSVNNATRITRRGGKVVLFGVRDGESILEDAHRIVMNGLTLRGVVGREIFKTWRLTQTLLEHADNGIQQAIWEVILNRGEGTVMPVADWNRAQFEDMITAHPKALIRFSD